MTTWTWWLSSRSAAQTFKVNLKTADQVDRPERTYQATFDTVAGAPVQSGSGRPPLRSSCLTQMTRPCLGA